MHNQRTIPRVCKTCGAAFMAWASAIKPTIGQFCSRRCSRLGQVGSAADRLWRKVIRVDDATSCWPMTSCVLPNGYGRIKVDHKLVAAHVLAWQLADGDPIPASGVVLHTCDNRRCVRNDTVGTYTVGGIICPRRGHLALGTRAINNADRELKGRTVNGAAQWKAKLTEDAVRAIRIDAAQGIRQVDLARRHGVSRDTISAIVRHESWRHIE